VKYVNILLGKPGDDISLRRRNLIWEVNGRRHLNEMERGDGFNWLWMDPVGGISGHGNEFWIP
jgi:hypothetical protein